MKSKEFSLKIEKIAKEKRGSLISKPLKEKIKADAIELRLLKGSASMPQGKLPL